MQQLPLVRLPAQRQAQQKDIMVTVYTQSQPQGNHLLRVLLDFTLLGHPQGQVHHSSLPCWLAMLQVAGLAAHGMRQQTSIIEQLPALQRAGRR